VGFFLAHVSPDLIGLNIGHRDVYNQLAHELFALLASRYQEPQNGVAMQAGEPFRTADAGTFQEHPKRHESLIHWSGHLAKGFLLFFREGLFAINAAKAEATVAVYREPLACPVAGGAGHRGFGFHCLLHDYIIRYPLTHCQGETVLI
jgi:hypothetical protein